MDAASLLHQIIRAELESFRALFKKEPTAIVIDKSLIDRFWTGPVNDDFFGVPATVNTKDVDHGYIVISGGGDKSYTPVLTILNRYFN